MIKRKKVNNREIWFTKHKVTYYPCMNFYDAILGKVSPSLVFLVGTYREEDFNRL